MIGVIGALDEHHAALLKLAGLTVTIIAMAAYIDHKEFSDFISVANDCVFSGTKMLAKTALQAQNALVQDIAMCIVAFERAPRDIGGK